MSGFGPDNPSRNAVDKFDEEIALSEMQAIHDYMHALLKRQLAVGTPILNAEPEVLNAESDFDCQSLPPLAELTARSKPSESIDLASMRELANSQTRAVLDTHQKTRLSNSILTNGAAGLACLTGTVVALICAPVLGQAMRIGEMAGVVASIYFLYTSFLSARALLNLMRSTTAD